VAVGFDGSRWRDSTALVVTHLRSGWQWEAGLWQHPGAADAAWEVPADEVDATVDEVFMQFRVVRLYGDPAQGWDVALARWSSRYGQKRVTEFFTDSRGLRKTAFAMRAYHQAMRSGDLTHRDDPDMAQHIGNARKRDLHMVDDEGQPLWTIEKERRDSPFKIDAAMAGALSWQARMDALTAGEGEPKPVGRISTAVYGFN
jgi:hypothetical protein